MPACSKQSRLVPVWVNPPLRNTHELGLKMKYFPVNPSKFAWIGRGLASIQTKHNRGVAHFRTRAEAKDEEMDPLGAATRGAKKHHELGAATRIKHAARTTGAARIRAAGEGIPT